MDKAALLEQLKRAAPSAEEAPLKDPKWVVGGDEPRIRLAAAEVPAAAKALKAQGFDLLDMVTAVDWVKENRFEMVYFFQKSSAPSEKLFLKADLPRQGEPSAPTLCGVYDAANWQEREVYDLMGIKFEGHPDLRRILLWEGYPGCPLRKDYVHTPDMYDNGAEIGLPKAAPVHAAAPAAPAAAAPAPAAPPPAPPATPPPPPPPPSAGPGAS
jgi:NADH-quinone oxidoreductase subunit C